MSEFGAKVDDILAKDGNQWSPEEHRVISSIVTNKNRERLKEVRAEIRSNLVQTVKNT